MKNKIRFIILLGLALAIIPCNSSSALTLSDSDDGASLFLLIDKTSYLDPDYLSLDIAVSSNSKINAIDSRINFSTSSLRLVGADKKQSICDINVSETINNDNGTYQLRCGTPDSLSGNDMAVVRLIFEKLKPGFAQVMVHEHSQVLAADGLGTNILKNREIHNIYIMK